MPWPVIGPFLRPPMKSNTAAEPRIFQGRRAPFPICGDLAFLSRSDHSRGKPAGGVIPVGIIDLDPVAAVIGPIRPVELAAVFADDEIHPHRSLIIALNRLLPLALAKTDVVLARHSPFLIEPHFVSGLI